MIASFLSGTRLGNAGYILLLLALAWPVAQVGAVPAYLDQWRQEYPGSTSADINCQLCHVQRDGGSPWNAYGRDIRNQFNQLDPLTRTIEEAFRMVETVNSDQDDPTVDNLAEIDADSQPGWREGRNNLGYDRDDQVVGLFFPPATIDPFPEKITAQQVSLELVDVAAGFTSPVGAAVAPVESLRQQLFVIDQVGIIWRVDLLSGAKEEYLNVAGGLVALGAFEPGGYDERGLLGFAFHPDFASNGRVYTYTSEPATSMADFTTLTAQQSADHQSVIRELRVLNPSASSGAADITSQRELMRLDQPQFNHNGGALLFDDGGYLFIGLGDGGGADDQGVGHGSDGNAADPSNPFGAILRIDPLGNDASNGQYGIPADNPFVSDSSKLDEIFAYGFRNPWKLSLGQSGKLYAADVGQNDVEEVNLVEKGQHYGWPIREGSFFFDPNGEFSGIISVQPPGGEFPDEILTDPLLQYDHDEGISVTGGYVYWGAKNRSLLGQYIFADFTKRIFIGDLSAESITATQLLPDIFIFSLAQDADGELYILGNATAQTSGTSGELIKLQSTEPEDDTMCVPVRAFNRAIVVVCL